MTGMTLGDATDLLQGPNWGCACSGPPPDHPPGDMRCHCQLRAAEARELHRAAHITAKLIAELTGRPPCPRCGARQPFSTYRICQRCTALMGWDPECVACLVEQAGKPTDGMRHETTCGIGRFDESRVGA